MNIILIDPREVTRDKTVTLTDGRRDHIREILAKEPGQTLRIGLMGGQLGTGRMLAAGADEVVLDVDFMEPPPPRAGIDLILALPRPIMLRRIFSQTAVLGIDHLFIIKANRVEKSFFQSSLLDRHEYEAHQRLGLEQAMDTIMPAVSIHKRFREFVEDILPPFVSRYGSLVLAHPDTPTRLEDLRFASPRERILLAIGPEGGWVDYEVERFKELGFQPASAGPRIMRVDTAVPVLIGQLTLARTLRVS